MYSKFNKYISNRWICANPYIFLRMMRGFLNAIILKKNTLRLLELFPTFTCQLSCKMCSVAKYKKNTKKIMELEDYEKLAKDAARMGANTISVLGGEPLLYNKLPELIQIFHRHHYFTAISTNGHRVNRQILDDLKKAGLDAVCFSMESTSQEINDQILGQGHYKKAMDNIRLAKEAGLKVFMGTVVFPDKLQDAKDVFDFCHKSGIHSSLNALAPVGNAGASKNLSEQEFKIIRQILKDYPYVSSDWAFSYFLKQRCPGGKEKVGITCNGDVTACSYLPLTFGNIFQESLKDIWSRMGKFSQFSKDFGGCLGAEDSFFRKHYLQQIHEFDEHPVHYKNHPNITPEKEPELFC